MDDAGRGIIHSEMPQQTSGRMRGFQLWINLPAKEKMKPAAYQDIQPDQIPIMNLLNGGTVKIIAGKTEIEDQSIAGPIQRTSTEPLFLDIRLPAGAELMLPIALGHNAFVYPYEGQLKIGLGTEKQILATHCAGLLSEGDHMAIQADDENLAVLLLTAKPLHEPIVQYGPFVMNTHEEIEQAIADYRNGRLVSQD